MPYRPIKPSRSQFTLRPLRASLSCRERSGTHLSRMAGGLYPNKSEFKRALLDATSEKYTAMVFKNGKNSIQESYSRFKCSVPPAFRLNFKPNGL